MNISVIIPSRGRATKLSRCVASLARQAGAGAFEVLVGLDGPDPKAAAAAIRSWSHAISELSESNRPRASLAVIQCPEVGQAEVRNRLLSRATGELVVFLNDDTLPATDLLKQHADAHSNAGDQPTLIVGASPWLVPSNDRLFDRAIRETSMVFFYNRMDAAPDHTTRDWGFRHAWMINLSAPTALVRQAGGLTVFPEKYGFEDDELAWRLAERFGAAVRYQPNAIATHDHGYEPQSYLDRERRLGRAALGFAEGAPACALAMFGRDITSVNEQAYSQDFVTREIAMARTAAAQLRRSAEMPADQGDVDQLYAAHLPAKRWAWRLGLLEAFAEREGKQQSIDTVGVIERPTVTINGATNSAIAA